MRTKAKIVLTVLFLFVGILVVRALRMFRNSVHIGMNRSQLAVIQYAIGDYISLTKQPSESMTAYIMLNYPQVEIVSNTILDYHKTAVRYVVEKREDGTFVGVYSAGEDKHWGTKDDIKREGTLVEREKEESDSDVSGHQDK